MAMINTTDLPLHMQEDVEEAPANYELTPSQTDSQPSINFSQWHVGGEGLNSSVHINLDGRLSIALNLLNKLPELPKDHALDVVEDQIDTQGWSSVPKMNILIMIVGSRGDVQPYVAFGKMLHKDGHRVRLATHETFRAFVEEHGIEFFNIGGNPHDLMSYMVKNPGLIPGFESLRNGDICRKRAMLAEMLSGCWLGCCSPDSAGRAFAVDVIISNPPAFAHIHCAEALGIPLLMSFTMPWCSTTAFSHPLVNVKESNAEPRLTNLLSYALADILTWQGMGDLINKFRTKTLGLNPLSFRSGPGVLERCKVPWTYCMSPSLVPKPRDWKSHIDVVGFYFLDLATRYSPPPALETFLAAGDPPIYIGFGSVVVEDPKAVTDIIFEATRKAGVRALLSVGWGGLGGVEVPPHIFILGNVPHDWLFDQNRVKAVIHHGGAGTSAIGLAKGRPTAVIPFFGDQAFWGAMIFRSGAGPEPIPHKKLRTETLAKAIQYLISPTAAAAAERVSEGIQSNDGTRRGVESLYRHLPLLNMRCDLDENRVAVWWSTEHCLRLSGFAAQVLANANLLHLDDLEIHRSREYETGAKTTDPLTGGSSAIFWAVATSSTNIARIFISPLKGAVRTSMAVPRGIWDIVLSVHQGLVNMPEFYGSEVRKPGKIHDFASGMKEAGKSVFFGYHDGIVSLFKEPIEGAKRDGWKGFLKGYARGYANATVKPAAGILGAMTSPIEGSWKQFLSKSAQNHFTAYQTARRLDGMEAVKNSAQAERDKIVQRFEALKPGAAERKAKMVERVRQALAEAEEGLSHYSSSSRSSSSASTASRP